MTQEQDAKQLVDAPDPEGRFGAYGGVYVPETLTAALRDLEAAYGQAKADPEFGKELERLLATYVGRPTPLYHARRLSEVLQCQPDRTAGSPKRPEGRRSGSNARTWPTPVLTRSTTHSDRVC